jgi:hypothetical protein
MSKMSAGTVPAINIKLVEIGRGLAMATGTCSHAYDVSWKQSSAVDFAPVVGAEHVDVGRISSHVAQALHVVDALADPYAFHENQHDQREHTAQMLRH